MITTSRSIVFTSQLINVAKLELDRISVRLLDYPGLRIRANTQPDTVRDPDVVLKVAQNQLVSVATGLVGKGADDARSNGPACAARHRPLPNTSAVRQKRHSGVDILPAAVQ